MMKIEELIKGNKNDNPKLRAKEMSDGRFSLYLDYYFGRTTQVQNDGKTKVVMHREKVYLNLYVSPSPKTPKEKETQKETIQLAKKIRFEKEQEYLEDKTGFKLSHKSKNFIAYFDTFVSNRKNKDVRVFEMAQRAFKRFLTKYYPQYLTNLSTTRLNSNMIEEFVDFVRDNYNGSTPLTIYKRFKQVVNKAIKEKIIKENPCAGIVIPCSDDVLVKDIMSQEEIKQLFSTHYQGENTNIRKGFAITCSTGIRYCDLVKLTWGNIDYSNNWLIFEQQKVSRDSSSSKVIIPLDNSIMAMIGKRPKDKAKSDLLLDMPSHTMCLKALKKWTAAAGIDKHITWHCGRHSFATNLLTNSCDIKTVSELLGHSTLKYTQVYAHATDQNKRKAIASLSGCFSMGI